MLHNMLYIYLYVTKEWMLCSICSCYVAICLQKIMLYGTSQPSWWWASAEYECPLTARPGTRPGSKLWRSESWSLSPDPPGSQSMSNSPLAVTPARQQRRLGHPSLNGWAGICCITYVLCCIQPSLYNIKFGVYNV